jgi:FkbM family methyltransferase
MFRRIAAATTGFACRTVGRRLVVRVARFVLWRARLDMPNDLKSNGESSLQRWVVNLCPPGRCMRVLDVGANVGRWSDSMLNAAREGGRLDELHLSAFEPSSYTYARLSEALQGRGVQLVQAALGDRSGHSTLHVTAPGAGTNSLYQRFAGHADAAREQVQITTLDAHALDAALDHLILVKIDTEGHDLAVLRGAYGLLSQRRISVIQFEYNHLWIYARSFLRDAFELLEPFGYRLGKLTPHGVEFYPHWDPDLETFVEGNYIACLPGIAELLPTVLWWKQIGSAPSAKVIS